MASATTNSRLLALRILAAATAILERAARKRDSLSNRRFARLLACDGVAPQASAANEKKRSRCVRNAASRRRKNEQVFVYVRRYAREFVKNGTAFCLIEGRKATKINLQSAAARQTGLRAPS